MGRKYNNSIMADSPMLAADVAQVRNFIDQDIAAAGLSPHPWSWNNVVSGDPVLAVQFKEMKDAIQRLWDFKARGPLPMWSSGVEPGGPSLGTPASPIFASDLTDLRTWLNQYEDNHPPSDQGLDTLCFDPRHPNRPIITDAWAQDIKDLALEKPPFVRANVKCRADNSIPPEDRELYKQAFNLYRGKGLRVFALFAAGEFEVIVPGDPDRDPKAPLDANFTNPYITAFSNKAADVSTYLYNNAGVEDYIIWNEPNVTAHPEKQLDPEHFAALLYHCWQKMTAVPRVYMGGIMFGFGVDENALNYLDGVYGALYNWGLGGGAYGAWPWTGINAHIHRDRTPDSDVVTVFDRISEIKTKWGDAGDTLVGEWGVTRQEETDPPTKLSHIFNLLKPRASIMLLHSHHMVEESPTEQWGLHDHSVAGSEYVLGAASNLHGPYDELVGP